jgi:hypothetical protein
MNERKNVPDDLDFFKGCLVALPIGIVMWILIIYGVWYLFQ